MYALQNTIIYFIFLARGSLFPKLQAHPYLIAISIKFIDDAACGQIHTGAKKPTQEK